LLDSGRVHKQAKQELHGVKAEVQYSNGSNVDIA